MSKLSKQKTYVCFPCMRAKRANNNHTPNCTYCNKEMKGLAWMARIPKRTRKAWQKFEKWYRDDFVNIVNYSKYKNIKSYYISKKKKWNDTRK